ncbi:MAG TPA: hypothetical protein PL037_08140, partial [Elusimicrobiales bacterium]|nr:hypothetical protein [Elusimicrobiales bacterium]
MPEKRPARRPAAPSTLLKEVLRREVLPAMGCTEPLAVAFCAASAASLLDDAPILKALITTDPGTYKNGLAVSLPNTGGRKGNLLAAALGLVIRRPGLGTGILRRVSPSDLEAAGKMIREGRVALRAVPARRGIYIECRLRSARGSSVCVVSGGHGNISLLEKTGRRIAAARTAGTGPAAAYKEIL